MAGHIREVLGLSTRLDIDAFLIKACAYLDCTDPRYRLGPCDSSGYSCRFLVESKNQRKY